MKIHVLKSKLQKVIVTESSITYEGSITIDPDILDAVGMYPMERVEINNSSNGNRLATYILKGERGSGEVVINGAASKMVAKGDSIHILAYGIIDESELKTHEACVVHTDKDNKVERIVKKKSME